MPRPLAPWRPRVPLHSVEQSVWTEDAYRRVLINFAREVEREIQLQQADVNAVREELEVQLDQERDDFIQANAARREKLDSATGLVGPGSSATLIEQFQSEGLDIEQQKRWEENEEVLMAECPLAFLSPDAESSLTSFSLLSQLQANLTRLTRERIRSSVSSQLLHAEQEAGGSDVTSHSAHPSQSDHRHAAGGTERSATTDDASPDSPPRLSLYRRQQIARLVPPRLFGQGNMPVTASASHKPTPFTETDVERKFTELAKLVDLRKRARQRTLLLSGAYCTPQAIAELRQRRKRGRSEPPTVPVSGSHAVSSAPSSPVPNAVTGTADGANGETVRKQASDLASARGESWVSAVLADPVPSVDAVRVALHTAQRAAEAEGQFLRARLEHAERHVARLETASGRGGKKAASGELKMWRAEVEQRRRECEDSPRIRGYQTLVARCTTRLLEAERCAASGGAEEPAHGLPRASRRDGARPACTDEETQAAGPPDSHETREDKAVLAPQIDLSGGASRGFRWLASRSKATITELVAKTGTAHPWVWREAPVPLSAPVSGQSRPSPCASVEVSAVDAIGMLGPRRPCTSDDTSVHGEVVYLLESNPASSAEDGDHGESTADTPAQSNPAAAYMERLAAHYLWPADVEKHVRHVLYASDAGLLRGVGVPLGVREALNTGGDETERDDDEDSEEENVEYAPRRSHRRRHRSGKCVEELCQVSTDELAACLSTSSPPALDGAALLTTSVVPRSERDYVPCATPRTTESHDGVRPLCMLTATQSCHTDDSHDTPTDSPAPCAENEGSGAVLCAYGSVAGRLLSVPRVSTQAVLHVDGLGDFGAAKLFVSGGSAREWKRGRF